MEYLSLSVFSSVAAVIITVFASYVDLFKIEKQKMNDKNIVMHSVSKNKLFILSGIVIVMLLGIVMHHLYPDDSFVHQAKMIVLVCFLFALAKIDFKHKIVPNKIVATALVVRVIIYIFEFIFYRDSFFEILKSSFVGAMIIGLFFFIVHQISKGKAIGMGDVKLFVVMASYQGMLNVMTSIFVSLIVSFLFSITLVLFRRKNMKDSIPFVPSLFVGTYLTIMLMGM